MRLLTAFAGILLSGTGAFCFAFYSSRFSDVAFVVGLVMMIAGIFNIIAYLVSGRGEKRTTDTALVEGLVTFFYGFAIISNQVTDSNLTMFFGTWLTLCGVTRFSQSLYVSRFNPKDWSKILPLSIISAMMGVVMMLPWLVSSVMSLMLVGGAMLVDGLSVIVYAMYMKRESAEEMSKGEAEALARAEAKKQAHLEARKEQERLRTLSKEEREKEEKIRRSKELQAEQERRARMAAAKAAKESARRSLDEDRTTRLRDEEVDAINRASADLISSANKAKARDEKIAAAKAERAVFEDSKGSSHQISSKPVWNKPTAIPKLHAESKQTEKKQNVKNDASIHAVKLDEIENTIPILEFEKVDLPKVSYASDKDHADRASVMKTINSIKAETVSDIEYQTVDLEELVAEPLPSSLDKDDKTRFTQKLDFSWIQKLNEEIDKKEKI